MVLICHTKVKSLDAHRILTGDSASVAASLFPSFLLIIYPEDNETSSVILAQLTFFASGE